MKEVELNQVSMNMQKKYVYGVVLALFIFVSVYVYGSPLKEGGGKQTENLPITLASLKGDGNESDSSIFTGDVNQLEQKFRQVKKRYEQAREEGKDVSSLDDLVAKIKTNRQQKRYQVLNQLLDQLSLQIDGFYVVTAESLEQTQPIVKMLPLTNERQILESLANNHYFKTMHRFRGAQKMLNSDGAIGRNYKKFSDVAAQRDALWLIRNGLIHSDKNLINSGVKAFDYAFKYQTKAGNFRNGRGVSARTSVGVDAFFLYSYGYAYLLLEQYPRYVESFERLKKYRGQAKSAMEWLAKNTDELYRQDNHAPNRLLFNAMAFMFNSKLTDLPKLNRIGHGFIQRALRSQTEEGIFIEKGGYDTSYQAVSILNLCLLFFYVDDQKLREDMRLALQKGSFWLKGKINDNGKVSVAGNTRTGLGQEKLGSPPLSTRPF